MNNLKLIYLVGMAQINEMPNAQLIAAQMVGADLRSTCAFNKYCANDDWRKFRQDYSLQNHHRTYQTRQYHNIEHRPLRKMSVENKKGLTPKKLESALVTTIRQNGLGVKKQLPKKKHSHLFR